MLDSEWLEQQYRPWGDGWRETVDRWAKRSRCYLARANLERNIQYGSSVGERLDLLKPSTADAPVLVFIHGGYWQGLDKDDYAFALEPLVTSGAVVATVNYSLCPEVTLDAQVEQVRAACAWIWRHVRSYGGDQTRIHVTGHSAGGHLTAMMAATHWPDFGGDLPTDLVKSAIPISGLFDLEPIRLSSLNDGVRMNLETAKRNSPLYLKPATALPVSVVVGGGETAEFHRQSRQFTDAWSDAAATVEYIEIPKHHHFAVIEAMTEPDNQLKNTIVRHIWH